MTSESPLGQRRRALIGIALMASVGVNVFVAGWWFGTAVRPAMNGVWFERGPGPGPGPGPGGPGGPWPGPPPGAGQGVVVSRMQMLANRLQGRLSPDGMAQVESLLKDIDTHFMQRMGTSAPLRERAKQILVAEPFDAEAFSKIFLDLQAQRTKSDAELARRIVDVIAKLPQEDRKVLAEITLFLPPP